MPFSFPSAPSVGQVSSQNGRQWAWDGYAWGLVSTVAGHSSTHGASGSDAVTIASSQVSDFSSASRSAVGAYGKTLLFG